MRASSIADIARLTSKRLCGASDGSFADCSLGSASAPAARVEWDAPSAARVNHYLPAEAVRRS